ncbi:MAG: class II aldolase/adducin family protein [Bacteroidetes bacterium]|nr:class II aldolase/adducin family protein [Bacteroidota bacterium]
MTEAHRTIAEQLIAVAHRVDMRGLVAATDGNISARLPGGTILTTPSGTNKGMLRAEDLVEVTMDGGIITGSRRPSTELKMHLFIYRHRPDINAVVHCHPVHATAMAAAGVPMQRNVFPEVVVTLGDIPLAPYGTPSTDALAESLRPFVNDHTAILLANHGVVTYAADLWDACFLMEKVEQTAHMLSVAAAFGGARPLTAAQVEELKHLANTTYKRPQP